MSNAEQDCMAASSGAGTIATLKATTLQSLPDGWVHIPSDDTESSFTVAELVQRNEIPLIKRTVKVYNNRKYSVSVLCQELPHNTSIHLFPETVNEIKTLLNDLTRMKMCAGNSDERFNPLVVKRGGVFNTRGGQIIAKVDSLSSTIRHVNCQILIPPNSQSVRCKPCRQYRNTLLALVSKQSDNTPQSQSLTSSATTSHSSTAQQPQSPSATSQPESFQQLFQSQQTKASCCPPRQRRWDPRIIRWSIYLNFHSSSTYKILRKSNCIQLPSSRTLNDYVHHFDNKAGFSRESEEQLLRDIKMNELKEYEKYVGIVADEMKIKESLEYNKNTGRFTGFTYMGETNDHISMLQNSQPLLASSAFAVMVRGLFKKFNYPIATFPVTNLNSDQILSIMMEATMRLEMMGFKVISHTLDGHSTNRRYFRLLSSATSSSGNYKIKNPFTDEARSIYFFIDPPHLIKTTRNCFQNNRRCLMFNGQAISWKFIEDLYYKTREGGGLSTQHKLRYEHLHLTSFSKMRVDLATQVLSTTVSKGLLTHFGEIARETSNFVKMFDHFFDMLNVSNYTTGVHSIKPFKMPYRKSSDFRLQWLKCTFLKWLDDWKQQVSRLPPTLKEASQLSHETLEGIHLTANSFIEMVEYVFTIPNVKSFLSERVQQDPLEKYFGRQRQRGGVNNNPTFAQYLKNEQALRVVSSIDLNVMMGNTRNTNSNSLEDISTAPLPKRRKTVVDQTMDPQFDSVYENIKTTVINLNNPYFDNHATLYKSGVVWGIAHQLIVLDVFRYSSSLTTVIKSLELLLLGLTNTIKFQHFSTAIFDTIGIIAKKAPGRDINSELHRYLTSSSYYSVWVQADMHGSSILQYAIGCNLFTTLIKALHPIPISTPHSTDDSTDLTSDEIGAISYVAGYLIRSLRKNINLDQYETLILIYCLMADPECNDDDHMEIKDITEWCDIIDRGGLFHGTAEFRLFLEALESYIKRRIRDCCNNRQSLKTNLLADITESSILIEYWNSCFLALPVSMLGSNSTNEKLTNCKSTLMASTCDLYIRLRGFCFAANWMEEFKRSNKRTIQKSKPLRASLVVEPTDQTMLFPVPSSCAPPCSSRCSSNPLHSSIN